MSGLRLEGLAGLGANLPRGAREVGPAAPRVEMRPRARACGGGHGKSTRCESCGGHEGRLGRPRAHPGPADLESSEHVDPSFVAASGAVRTGYPRVALARPPSQALSAASYPLLGLAERLGVSAVYTEGVLDLFLERES